jgi:anaerobic selenocysteine-containing dehydrogenase
VDEKTGSILKDGKVIGVMADGKPRTGFPSPSRKQEFYSQTMVDWGWPEYRKPTYIKSHIHEENMEREKGDFPLVPTFRLPTLIHSRSGNAKWLTEISNRNPIWMHPKDAARYSVKTGDLVRVNTEIGYFVDKVWVTEGMKPGVVACSHHIGRWRRPQDQPGNRWATNLVSIEQTNGSKWKMRVIDGIRPYQSDDPDSSRIFWSDGGVHQNITFPVHPDPISGMHCWHQKVRIENVKPEDRYGDVYVDTEKALLVYREWLKMTRPAPGPNGLRRPLWLGRPLRPVEETFYLKD